jgi:hypothetical protein
MIEFAAAFGGSCFQGHHDERFLTARLDVANDTRNAAYRVPASLQTRIDLLA